MVNIKVAAGLTAAGLLIGALTGSALAGDNGSDDNPAAGRVLVSDRSEQGAATAAARYSQAIGEALLSGESQRRNLIQMLSTGRAFAEILEEQLRDYEVLDEAFDRRRGSEDVVAFRHRLGISSTELQRRRGEGRGLGSQHRRQARRRQWPKRWLWNDHDPVALGRRQLALSRAAKHEERPHSCRCRNADSTRRTPIHCQCNEALRRCGPLERIALALTTALSIAFCATGAWAQSELELPQPPTPSVEVPALPLPELQDPAAPNAEAEPEESPGKDAQDGICERLETGCSRSAVSRSVMSPRVSPPPTSSASPATWPATSSAAPPKRSRKVSPSP